MNEYVASYLLKNNFMLTALEFYQELLEEGLELKILRDYFENKEYKNVQENTNGGGGMMIQVDSEHTKALEEQLKKKDEKISLMEYEIKLLQSDIAKLKGQMREAFTSTVKRSHSESEVSDNGGEELKEEGMTSPPTNQEQNGDGLESKMASEPLTIQEKQVINYLIKDYLTQQGYKISAISFSDEVHEMDMFNLDEMLPNHTNENDLPLGLHYLYRHYYSAGDKTKQNMKDTKALREALSQLEAKDKLIQNLEKTIQRQDKSIEKLKAQNKALEQDMSNIKEEKTAETTAASTETHHQTHDDNETDNLNNSTDSISNDVMVLQAKLREYENQESSIVQIVGEKLPTLLAAVKSNERQEFMPILTATLQAHPDAEVRETLSEALFNLVKKPDQQERQMIINGCIALARRISPDRFEKEVLPQCWKQMTHKYTERKILVAEACGELAHYVKASLRPTMLLSTLAKLMEDKTDEVRESVVINLAKLISTFTEEEDVESKSKYFQIEEMTLKFLYDKAETVESASIRLLVPALITWCFNFDYLFEKFAPTLLSNIENLIKKRLKSGSSASSAKIVVLLKCFSGVIPYLHKMMLNTMPAEMKGDVKDEATLKKLMDKYLNDNPLSELEKTKSATWKGLYWLLNVCIRRVLSIAASVNIEHANICKEIYVIFNSLCETFGEPCISKVFEMKIITLLETNSDPIIDGTIEVVKKDKDADRSSVSLAKERLLPVYICGTLPFSPKEKIMDVIKSLIINVSISERTWDSSHMPFLYNALISAVTNEKLRGDVLSVVCKLAVNPSKVVRSAVADILVELIQPLSSDVLSATVLPALITLASDMEAEIKVKAVRGLGTLACNLNEVTDFDKLATQIENILETRDRTMFKEILIMFSKIIPEVESYFRDFFIIKKLVWLGKQNNLNSDLRDRRDTAGYILDNYRALNGCMLTDDIIDQLIEGLDYLSKDCELITDSSVASFVSQMKEELEHILEQHAKEESKGSTLISLTSLFEKMKPASSDGNSSMMMGSSTTASTASSSTMMGSSATSGNNSTSSTQPQPSTTTTGSAAGNSTTGNTGNTTNWQGISGGAKTTDDSQMKENLKKIFTFGLMNTKKQ
ncbi:hypothetical protein C9374_006582 [Naegleria lovaniensis]|uniref:LisH domain-containing protein n=1 Tax=Naegleria lovaniensis TaxID=51637 RepID=A0AA88KHD7_NAELO|nr:uncharacterized protein C9374_006582 [Naegleria lovaniensis]KAG2379465.1 hypothetical protein C9374_006582 [Naegleria lovaniensis]